MKIKKSLAVFLVAAAITGCQTMPAHYITAKMAIDGARDEVSNVVFTSDSCAVADMATCLDPVSAAAIQDNMTYIMRKSDPSNAYFPAIPPLMDYHTVQASYVAKWLEVDYGVK